MCLSTNLYLVWSKYSGVIKILTLIIISLICVTCISVEIRLNCFNRHSEGGREGRMRPKRNKHPHDKPESYWTANHLHPSCNGNHRKILNLQSDDVWKTGTTYFAMICKIISRKQSLFNVTNLILTTNRSRNYTIYICNRSV